MKRKKIRDEARNIEVCVYEHFIMSR